jgi:hypothetical protein
LSVDPYPGAGAPDRQADLARLVARFAELPEPCRPGRWSQDDEQAHRLGLLAPAVRRSPSPDFVDEPVL